MISKIKNFLTLSFLIGIAANMRNAKKISIASGATGVPAIIVDGKYLTSVTHAGSTQEMFKVVDQLVKKAAAER